MNEPIPSINMKWRRVGDVMICVSGNGAVPDEVWARYLDSLENEPITKYIGVTIGSTQVTSVQRKSGTEVLKRRGIQPAVVTDDRLVRGIVTAASWLGLDIKAFATDDIPKALEWLGVDVGLSQEILDTTKDLTDEVS